MLTLFGLVGDYPPTDPDGFDTFLRSLRFPDIRQAVRAGQPIDDPKGFRFPATSDAGTNGWRTFPKDSSPWATPCARSTPSTGRA
jgi:hypothetical protein